ncbi:hypothetical protein CORC01_01575 [Colletotrichum orchidophilum]|uniref:Uncharacterized protein n=1 Tax=Colletotrichum orchidophilum TaxID=1209926 RepID=A0A1G4BP06_9PEZI|nr:uncharacterized protein CORC01_01575 [Colletotrichum orchidophilum]OHF03191.1 hypothetical protein CORC01_01575 [Colletotrichum orchidophilum]
MQQTKSTMSQPWWELLNSRLSRQSSSIVAKTKQMTSYHSSTMVF